MYKKIVILTLGVILFGGCSDDSKKSMSNFIKKSSKIAKSANDTFKKSVINGVKRTERVSKSVEKAGETVSKSIRQKFNNKDK